MPELPEVESIRIGLEQLIQGKTIKSVSVYWDKIIESPSVTEFKEALKNQQLIKVNRRGKFLIFKLTDYDLVSHLRMEGKYEYHPASEPKTKHTHVVFHLKNDTELRYLDVRKFGRMTLLPKDEGLDYPGIQKLGPEPIPSEFKLDQFKKELKRRRQAIKPLLLNQQLVTGLGNIYVDEALYRSQIHPEQPAQTLTQAEIEQLYQMIITVLAEAVEAGGSTIRTYKNSLGEAGTFQFSLQAYGKTGEPCARCQTPIEKIKVAQRGTHYCPKCQSYKKRKVR